MVQSKAHIYSSCHLAVDGWSQSACCGANATWRNLTYIILPYLHLYEKIRGDVISIFQEEVLRCTYLCCIAQVHVTSTTGSISQVGVKRIAKGWQLRSRLVVVQRTKVGREIAIRHICNDLVNNIDQLRSDFFAFRKGLLGSGIVNTRQYII